MDLSTLDEERQILSQKVHHLQAEYVRLADYPLEQLPVYKALKHFMKQLNNIERQVIQFINEQKK